ncbi:MAG: hypothetical protein DI563_01760 [Variovorax paradoxus]|uniref:Uncharacterized protein n=1 Tax=Variovorax paradoxus TaxID=34073 RepID=A0A2W5QNW9_VARPD|nr:MAG: hypothetical protein DI563_01760 [Variovorax paradoxus]
MRNTKAKLFRKIAYNDTFATQTTYTSKLHKPKEIWTGKLNDDGTKKMTVIQMATILLHPNCTRKVYKDMKAIHKA